MLPAGAGHSMHDRRLAAAIRHPGIIRIAVYSIGEQDGCIKKLVACCGPGKPRYREERRFRIVVNPI
jgi:hypothetical protein